MFADSNLLIKITKNERETFKFHGENIIMIKNISMLLCRLCCFVCAEVQEANLNLKR